MIRGTLLALLLAMGAQAADTAPPLSAGAAELRELLRNRQVEEAIERDEARVEATPGDADTWQWLGHAYGQQAIAANILTRASWAGRCRDAYEKAVELAGHDAGKRMDLLNFYLNAPTIVGGGEDRARALAAGIRELGNGWGEMADAQIALTLDGDKAHAERLLRQAVGTLKEPNRARNALGALYGRDKRWADMRALWNEALAADANDPVAMYMLGRTAAVSGEELETGLRQIDRYLALAQKPWEIGAAPAHWRRGLILEKLGRKEEAVHAIRAAVQADPRLAEARADLERLES